MKTWIGNPQMEVTTGAAETMQEPLEAIRIYDGTKNSHISNELRAYCSKHYRKDYYLYKSVPGIGGITAAGILSELGDIRRFNRLDELAAIVGFSSRYLSKQ